MYQQGGTIKQVVDRIARNEYVLPAIQREFVWLPDQVCKLFDSVMQGYPFGEFLFWSVEAENAARYRYYGFVRDYDERDPHCPDLGILRDQPLTAVLDGQQRLTAFNIGLRGSMATKLPYRWWNNPDAFPRRVLALDLLAHGELDEEGSQYVFAFINEDRIGRTGDELWFRVSDIMDFEGGLDMTDWILDKNLDNNQHRIAYRILDRLHRVVTVDPTIFFFEETEQDLDRVLHIFIRRNSGGTVLSYSDLLLSIATAQWKGDARKAVHELVDEMNWIGNSNRFDFSKDFVLKAGLMLTDIASVGFKVENFTHDNMKKLEKNWQKIRSALIRTVELAASFGYNRDTIGAASSLLPIAYYLYRRNCPENFVTHGKFADDRAAIRGWLMLSRLKSGVWGSGLDTLLTALRDTMQREDIDHFPEEEMRRVMSQRGKSLNFEQEEIEELADMKFNDQRIFTLLALLFPFVDLRNQFHVDHIFPHGRFTPNRLRREGVAEEDIETFRDHSNRLGNLQLLIGDINNEKRMQLPAEWLDRHFSTQEERQHYCDNYLLGVVPKSIFDFEKFYQDRRERLRQRIGVVLDEIGGYENLLEELEELEELESIRAYDQAKSRDDEAIPFEQAVEEIERER